MKYRESFVTNSSSSSFICNTKLSEEEVEAELRRVLNLYNEMMDTNYIYEDCFGCIDTYTEEWYKNDRKEIDNDKLNGYSWNGYGYEKEKNIGKIMIHSEGDNTIPYQLFDIIEEKFDAIRYHLG